MEGSEPFNIQGVAKDDVIAVGTDYNCCFCEENTEGFHHVWKLAEDVKEINEKI